MKDRNRCDVESEREGCLRSIDPHRDLGIAPAGDCSAFDRDRETFLTFNLSNQLYDNRVESNPFPLRICSTFVELVMWNDDAAWCCS
jgi:hypothetical protein